MSQLSRAVEVSRLNRRHFIKVISGGSVILVPGLVGGCVDSGEDTWLEGWNGPHPDENDIRWIVLSYAILAANPHNKQAWIVDLTGPRSVDLYVDQSRLLPQTDPPARQIHIGQGTFLENLVLAAKQHGKRADITYFPQGEYGNDVVENKPVASIILHDDPTAIHDPLFNEILRRQSNKRDYSDEPLTMAQLDAFSGTAINSGLSLTVTDDPAVRRELTSILTEAMRIEASDQTRDLETVEMFRFDDEERRRYRDGFGVDESGMTGFRKWLVESFFLSREDTERDTSSFGEQAVDMTDGQAQSAAAFGWITTPSNTRLDQVVTGRAYERLNLAASALGIAMHPMSQVLQEYDDMAELQRRFLDYLNIPQGQTVQMLFRLGIAEPVEHSPRRDVKDLQRG